MEQFVKPFDAMTTVQFIQELQREIARDREAVPSPDELTKCVTSAATSLIGCVKAYQRGEASWGNVANCACSLAVFAARLATEGDPHSYIDQAPRPAPLNPLAAMALIGLLAQLGKPPAAYPAPDQGQPEEREVA
jgi:hypothetical protein